MKRLLLLLALVPLLACAADPAPAPVETLNELKALAEQAPVAAIDLVLPSDEQEIEKALWDRFANKPDEQRFAVVTTHNWEAKWEIFAEALITKARNRNLDQAKLRECLEALNKGGTKRTQTIYTTSDQAHWERSNTVGSRQPDTLEHQVEGGLATTIPDTNSDSKIRFLEATIPVGAYLAHHANGQCWIIACKWEVPVPELRLDHIRIWAIDCTTRTIIGFIGCD